MKVLLSLICLLLPLTVMAQDVELEPIITENADQIEQINVIGYGLVDDMTYTPDGEQIVLAGSLGLIFYDAELYEHVPADRWFVPEETVRAIAFSPDGSTLATISGDILAHEAEDDVLRLWDIGTKTTLSERSMARIFNPDLEFSPDGTELAIAHIWDEDGVPHWNVSDPTNIVELEPEKWSSIQRRWYAPQADLWTAGYTTTYSPNGNTIAFVTSGGVTAIDTVSQKELYTVQAHEYYGVDKLIVTPNSGLLIGTAWSEWATGSIDIWDIATGERLLEMDHGAVTAFALHPTEPALLFKPHWGSEIYYWNENMGNAVTVFSHDSGRNSYTDIDFNHNGSILAAVHAGAVEFWDVVAGVKVRDDLHIEQSEYTETVDFGRVVFSPDGNFLAIVGSALDGVSGGSYIHLWDMDKSDFVGHIAYDELLLDFAFSPDGTIIASYHHRYEFEPAPNVVYLWDVESVLESDEIAEPLASIWTFNLGPFFLADVVFNPDGQYIALIGHGQTSEGIEIWEVSTILENQEVGSYEGFNRIGRITTFNGLGPIAFSPDGSKIVSNSSGTDCYLTQTTIETGEQVCLGSFPDSNVPRAITFLSDDIVVSGAEDDWRNLENVSTDVRIWDANTRELLNELEGHFEEFNDIAVSPDGRIIVSAGGGFMTCYECPPFDGALRVWGVPAGD